MPKQHGLSHALAVFATTLAAGGVKSVLGEGLPHVAERLTAWGWRVVKAASLPVSGEVLVWTLIAAGFAFLWGVAFYYAKGAE